MSGGHHKCSLRPKKQLNAKPCHSLPVAATLRRLKEDLLSNCPHYSLFNNSAVFQKAALSLKATAVATAQLFAEKEDKVWMMMMPLLFFISPQLSPQTFC